MQVEIGPVSWRALEVNGDEDGAAGTYSVDARIGPFSVC